MTQPQTPAALICPKCGADMRAYERNGVTVDQCSGCRGIFLDRGELERLVDAEGAYYDGAARPAPAPGRDERYGGYQEGRYDKHGSKHGDKHGGEHGKGRRREGFLGDLFG